MSLSRSIPADHRLTVRLQAGLVVVAFLAASIGALAPSGVRAATHAVTVGDGFFSPSVLTVAVGDTITWTNEDDSPHTVTGSAFDSGNLEPGDSFSYTVTEAGTFAYVCSYHDEMTGSIVAMAGGDPSGEAPAPSVAAAPAASEAPAASGAPSGAGAPHASHAATADGEQPNTALAPPPSSVPPWTPALLMGLGLVALALGLVPVRRSVQPAPRRGAGWRR